MPYCVTCPSMSTDPGSLNPGTRRSKTYLICIAQVLENCFHTPNWHSVRGRQCEYQLNVETCDHEPCTQPTTTTTTNTPAFNDTSRHIGDKNWIQQVLVGLSSSFPINYTCYHYTAVGKYCTLCVQTAEWCQLAWGTMETRFVYFLIVKWTLHSACFASTAMTQIYILGARLMSFKKIKHISMSYLG